MMEKNGMLTLTQKDMDMYKEGKVSSRVKEKWELDFTSMEEMVKAGSFQIVNDNTDDSSE